MCPHNSRSHWTAILHQMAGTLWMLLFVALNVFYGHWNEEYKTERGWLTIHRTIDSQKHSGWKSPLKLPCLKPTHPHRVHQCHISTVLGHPQGWWPHHPLGSHACPLLLFQGMNEWLFPNSPPDPHSGRWKKKKIYIKVPFCKELCNLNFYFSSLFFKDFYFSPSSQIMKTLCGRIISNDLWLLANSLGTFLCCSCLMAIGLEGLSFRRNVHHTWKHNALERALVESPGIGVCKASRSTITGLHCHGRQGAFPGGFE